jgi:hypothetical protein
VPSRSVGSVGSRSSSGSRRPEWRGFIPEWRGIGVQPVDAA